jgi:hypothetical protein
MREISIGVPLDLIDNDVSQRCECEFAPTARGWPVRDWENPGGGRIRPRSFEQRGGLLRVVPFDPFANVL